MQGARAKTTTQNLSSVNSQLRGRGTGSGAVAPFGCGRAQRKSVSRSIGGMQPSLKARAKYALSASHGAWGNPSTHACELGCAPRTGAK